MAVRRNLNFFRCTAIFRNLMFIFPGVILSRQYSELLQQLFWGYSLRMFWIADEGRTELYASFYESFICSLEKADADNCSTRLEELMLNELGFTVRHLVHLGISGAGKLLADEHT